MDGSSSRLRLISTISTSINAKTTVQLLTFLARNCTFIRAQQDAVHTWTCLLLATAAWARFSLSLTLRIQEQHDVLQAVLLQDQRLLINQSWSNRAYLIKTCNVHSHTFKLHPTSYYYGPGPSTANITRSVTKIIRKIILGGGVVVVL